MIKKVSAQLSIKFLSIFLESLPKAGAGRIFQAIASPEVFLRG